jgi:hypothetical protein
MASADFCPPIGPPLDDPSLWLADRPPGVRRVTFTPHTRRIYARKVRVASGFESYGPLAHLTDASYAVRVPRAGVLPAASFPQHLAVMRLLFG